MTEWPDYLILARLQHASPFCISTWIETPCECPISLYNYIIDLFRIDLVYPLFSF